MTFRFLPRSRRRWNQVINTLLLISLVLLILHFQDITNELVGSGGEAAAVRHTSRNLEAVDESLAPCPLHVELADVQKLAKNLSLNKVAPCRPTSPRAGTDGITKVLLVTYQRSGSSFLGELLNQNPDTLYMFEPVDAVYAATYGTGYGWNVPDHIMSNDYGNAREHSPDEVTAVAEALRAILTCDFSHVPTPVLTHTFLRVFFKRINRLQPFVNCLGKRKAIAVSYRCRRFLDKFCPRKYYPGSALEFCHLGIMGKLDSNMKVPLTLFDVFAKHKMGLEDVKKGFLEYNQCIKEVKVHSDQCLSHVKPVCQKSSMRGIKTVRVSMEMAIHLLKHIPDLKIIHNVRDPRGVTLSRMRINHGDMMSSSSGADIVKEARILCATMARHIQLRRALEKLRPGTSMQVTYEDFASRPLEVARDIYRFIGHQLPSQVTEWLRVNALGEEHGKAKARNASAISQAWENKISFSKAKQIDGYCRTLYDMVSNRWGT